MATIRSTRPTRTRTSSARWTATTASATPGRLLAGACPTARPTRRNPGSGSAPLTPGDYIVKVEIPNDPIQDRPLYTPTREEDVNVFSGDSFKPAYPPPPCVGALHTVHVTNQDFIDAGGSPFDGQARPLCDAKLVPVRDGEVDRARTSSSSPTCPVPGKFWGLVNDNLNVSIDPKATLFGEIAGIGNAPVGIYDFTDRLIDTVHTDPNGFFTSLVPSTSTYNCPLPAGPCPSVYRVVGNDPGQPSARNLDYHPEFDTISANFQAWPGLMLPGRHGQHSRRHAGAVARLERHQAGAVPDRGHDATALRGVGPVRQRR